MGSLVQSPRALGSAIRDARYASSLTQVAAAERAGVSQATLSKLERGVAHVSFETLLRVLSQLDLELHVEPKRREGLKSPWERG